MKLKVITGETAGQEFKVIDGMNLIGRSCAGNDTNIIDLEPVDTDAKDSRRHAMIEKKGETIIIWDLGSLNGTFVNQNERLKNGEQCHLKEGDKVIIGKTALLVAD